MRISNKTPNGEDPEGEQITLKLTGTLLEQVDDQWREQGFPNRSEYIRHELHDAVTTPALDRDELLTTALGERELRQNPDAAMSREEARELADTDEGGLVVASRGESEARLSGIRSSDPDATAG